MQARPTAAEALKKDDDLMLARDGSDRVEKAKGSTSITIGRALEDAKAGADVWAFIAIVNVRSLSADDTSRLYRTIDEGRTR